MCGRIAQHRYQREYLYPLALEVRGEISADPIARYNVAPSTSVWVLTGEEAGARSQHLRWGWAPHWARGGKPPAINAKAETLWTSRYWAAARHNRLIVPADGWFEWVAAEGKQPYYIHAGDDGPLYFAAVGTYPTTARAQQDDDGFAVVTCSAEGRMVDIHDRRPLALSAEVASEWLDQATPQNRIEDIAAHGGLGPEAFAWHRVPRSVGPVRNQGPELIAPN